jgi:hemerythrin superfamily protein
MSTDTPGARLLHDHQEIELLLDGLLAAFESGERSIATPAFQAFERRLSAHLAFEEEMLFPALAEIDRGEADALAADHQAIRLRVEELAIMDNLHVSRATQVHQLVEMLRAHARREESVLYRLADRLEDQPTMRARLDTLRRESPASA